MMSFSSKGRIIIGVCADKERDEKLLNFLSAQKNKSEFIRQALYEKIEREESDSCFEGGSSSKSVLGEILNVLNNISNSINSNTFIGDMNSRKTNNTKRSDFSGQINLNENPNKLVMNEEKSISNEDSEILSAIANSFGDL